MFTKTFSHRDDWLHWGESLYDMDYHHYARFVGRVPLPRAGGPDMFLKWVGVWRCFDGRYALSATYVQVLYEFPKTAQNVGLQCKRSVSDGGEDNAID